MLDNFAIMLILMLLVSDKTNADLRKMWKCFKEEGTDRDLRTRILFAVLRSGIDVFFLVVMWYYILGAIFS